MAQVSASARYWTEGEQPADLHYRFWLAVVGSLLLHGGILAFAAWVRLPQPSEKPLASVEVSLVSEPSQPSPPVKVIDPPKAQVKVQAKTPVAPPPATLPAKAAPASPPTAPSTLPEPVDQPVKDSVSKDVVNTSKIEPPPDAPKWGDLSPAQRPVKRQLKLPDVPVVSEVTEPFQKASGSKPRPSLVEELNRELERELRNVRNMDLPHVTPAESPPKPTPPVEAKAPSVKAVDTTLKIAGVALGSNAYLSRVRQRISSVWNAPPVDMTGRSYVVVVRFRLHRDGSVTGVEIVRSSGNEYYDLAGQRAVLAARPLPAFPPDIAESYYDVYFTFAVGDTQG